LITGCGIGGAVEGTKIKDASEEGPAVGDIGNKDGCAGFADIPERPDGAEGFREGVVFV
jgi:hypothetical protein